MRALTRETAASLGPSRERIWNLFTQIRRRFGSGRLGKLVLIGMVAAGLFQEGSAQAAERFISEALRLSQPAELGEEVLRSRQVIIDASLLMATATQPSTAGSQPLVTSAGAPDPTLVLDLFVDTQRVAVFDYAIQESPNTFTWVGTIQDEKESLVVLTRSKDSVAGVIQFSGETYEIRPGDGGVHRVQQVDTALLPDCDGPISLPLPVTSSSKSSLKESVYSAAEVEIDLLVLYTPAARSDGGGTTGIQATIANAVTRTNISLERSEVEAHFRLVGHQEIAYEQQGFIGTDLINLREGNGALAEAGNLRNQFGADLVSLFIGNSTGGAVGVAYLPSSPLGSSQTGFSVMALNFAFANGTLAHELGHNLGAGHAPQNPNPQGLFEYSHGYVNPVNGNATLLASACLPGLSCTRILNYSSSTVIQDGFTTGRADQDNARTLQEMRSIIAGYRPAQPPACPHQPGDEDFCRDCGPCAEGQGDCEVGECLSGLVCNQDVGALYGFSTDTDVCESPSTGCPWPLGHPAYCRDCGPCGAGEGDCDPGQCLPGLTCADNVGANYGFAANIDVCEDDSPPSCPWAVGHPRYCTDCGPCEAGEGDCDTGECESGLECAQNVGAAYGFAPHIDVCEETSGGCPWSPGHGHFCRDCGPCGVGQGDCDIGQCQSGLVCAQDVGANYGFPSNIDVCEADCPWQPGDPHYCRDCGPCGEGLGDCDGSGECQDGLICAQNVGANYGWTLATDVCEAAASGPLTLFVTPDADSWVSEVQPDTNYGFQSALRISYVTLDRRYSFLRFPVPPISGTILSAKLKLRTRSSTIPEAGFYAVESMSWSEGAVTWNNWSQPTTTYSYLRSLHNLASESWVEVDVTEAVTANSSITLGIATGTAQSGLRFYSRQSSYAPVLEVTYQLP